ncbi:hypothetical protein [Pelagibius sp. Alg239-R121]|uniref:hypothetical protein n=1 Tax=Pelagibius sp. Alg239-R121 TaxID=2993448 RepID=UPI0024A75819|nr:hypothetical protein [Pelagibius sp. Alg239-R121]
MCLLIVRTNRFQLRKSLVLFAMFVQTIPAIAAEIEIQSEPRPLELAPATVTDGYAVDFDTASIGLQVQARGAEQKISDQCTRFEKMVSDQEYTVDVARDFPPQRPYPQFVVIYRPSSPGWSNRWERALNQWDDNDGTRFSPVSTDWRPEVLGITIKISDRSVFDREDLAIEVESFFNQVNKRLYERRNLFRDPGSVSTQIDSLLILCSLRNNDLEFGYNVIMKGPNLIRSSQILDGEIDAAILSDVQDLLIQDNVPPGVLNDQLELTIYTRLVGALTQADNHVAAGNVSKLYSFAVDWARLVAHDFRELTRGEMATLIAGLIEEELASFYLFDQSQISFEAFED